MIAIILEAALDTIKLLPFLFTVYVLIELFERRFGESLERNIRRVRTAGPLLGAMFGCIPQCSFSVISAVLYSRGLISTGTLLAVFLSTSDEAIPIMLAQPGSARFIGPLVACKIFIAIAAGYAIDLFSGKTIKTHGVETYGETIEGCCGHECSGTKPLPMLLIHPLKHTVKVFVFLFATTLLITIAVQCAGETRLHQALAHHRTLQPLLAALVGLIPNCAASVAVSQVFLKGIISFGAAIAGLCAGAGLGLLVLVRENRSKADTLRIIALLFCVSVLTGAGIQYLYG